jgi:hypothetical protein
MPPEWGMFKGLFCSKSLQKISYFFGGEFETNSPFLTKSNNTDNSIALAGVSFTLSFFSAS